MRTGTDVTRRARAAFTGRRAITHEGANAHRVQHGCEVEVHDPTHALLLATAERVAVHAEVDACHPLATVDQARTDGHANREPRRQPQVGARAGLEHELVIAAIGEVRIEDASAAGELGTELERARSGL